MVQESNPGVDEFSAQIQTGPGSQPACYTMRTRSFRAVKQPRHGIEHSPPFSVQVKERTELYPYSTSKPLWLALGQTLPLLLPLLLPLCLYTSPLRFSVSGTVLKAVITLCLHDS